MVLMVHRGGEVRVLLLLLLHVVGHDTRALHAM